MRSNLTICSVLGLSLMLGACSDYHEHDRPASPPTGSLTRNYDLVGKDGVHYGSVEMNPVGGGKVYDSDGRLIGRIVTPDHD